MESVKLTQYSHGGGCGCKISPTVLESILKGSRDNGTFSSLLTGNEGNEDAAAWQLSNDQILLSTTDFFMPIVDNPEQFGAIAASNAISDIYAMGGTPIFALAVLGWPIKKLDAAIAASVLSGAQRICREAGIPIAGGHSIDSPEPIFGLAVNGLVASKHLKKNKGAKKGDLIFLSKALGTGMITTAAKRGKANPEDIEQAIMQMCKLNREGAELGKIEGVHALTDVTGFGLAGHLLEVCRASQIHAEINLNTLPKLSGVDSCISQMIFPDMTTNNFKACQDELNEMDMQTMLLLCDPQTSGGLLIAVDPASAGQVASTLKKFGSYPEPIGQFTDKGEHTVQLIA